MAQFDKATFSDHTPGKDVSATSKFTISLQNLDLDKEAIREVRNQAVKAALEEAKRRATPIEAARNFSTFSTFSTFGTFGSGSFGRLE